ncbi:NAD(P)H-dependent oxidoreductase [Roseateles cellulosilyticus]|uniref:NAD(P)H-dependent oxidoreductase n=1 Tax=Pelomonas cellulosilytica TaxID=2906762 RepID=A0ABS8Y072_9BURK|nr:NAD(P)H-dependent oxidoreductase [Pelomonas sp. P8]MCE4556426.1 NAD(P)H-dependent oxidoreductase [Pelomonas sp. P8]
MPRRVLLIQAHPDAAGGHLCHALADAYVAGARRAGHEVRTVDVAQLDFPLLRSPRDWQHGEVPAALHPAQDGIRWAEHLVLVFPLWLGDMPALLKAFLEQIARPGFAFDYVEGNPLGRKLLGGRSARVVVTMGMPALVYRWVFRAHSVRSLERNILGFVGIGPIHETLVGGVDGLGETGVKRWLRQLEALGRRAG